MSLGSRVLACGSIRNILLITVAVAALRAPASASGPDANALRRHWEAANRTAIAKLQTAKERDAARKEFDATLERNDRAAPITNAGDLRAAAAAELAVPGRYQLHDQPLRPRPKTLWQRIWEWLSDQWDRLWNALFGHIHLGANGSIAFGDILIVLAGGIVLFAIFRLLVNMQLERDARRQSDYQLLDRRRSAHALYLEASAMAARGAFADAVRTLFVAAVVALDLRGTIHDDASATVGEMRRQLRARDALLAEPFDAVAGEFVGAAYAETPVASANWERARAGYARLIARPDPT
jgi:hypothetical protein